MQVGAEETSRGELGALGVLAALEELGEEGGVKMVANLEDPTPGRPGVGPLLSGEKPLTRRLARRIANNRAL